MFVSYSYPEFKRPIRVITFIWIKYRVYIFFHILYLYDSWGGLVT